MLHRIARPLTPPDFTPYGNVIGADGRTGRPINRGSSLPVDGGGALDLLAGGARPVLAVFRTHAQPPQGPWQEFERHRLGSQSFVPLGSLRCLLLVARGDAAPDPATLAGAIALLAFVALAASFWPAWGASKMDPSVALREL